MRAETSRQNDFRPKGSKGVALTGDAHRQVHCRLLQLLGWLTLTAALSLTIGCSSPTRPTQEDRFPVYSGQWRGVIGDVHVVLQIQAERGFGLPALGGTGTYRNGATGETGRLTVSGIGTFEDTANSSAFFNISTAYELGADGQSITKPAQPMGQFRGNVSGGTWPGEFQGPRTFGWNYDGIFGILHAMVTFMKD
jgi:hypothetical protein